MNKINDDEFVLSTGKKFCANCNILGIFKEDDNAIHVTGGYDHGIEYQGFNVFTKEERQEIAEYVINLWKEWAK